MILKPRNPGNSELGRKHLADDQTIKLVLETLMVRVSIFHARQILIFFLGAAILDQIKDEWEFVVDPDVSAITA